MAMRMDLFQSSSSILIFTSRLSRIRSDSMSSTAPAHITPLEPCSNKGLGGRTEGLDVEGHVAEPDETPAVPDGRRIRDHLRLHPTQVPQKSGVLDLEEEIVDVSTLISLTNGDLEMVTQAPDVGHGLLRDERQLLRCPARFWVSATAISPTQGE